MARRAGEAIDEAQAKLDKKCERLLASSAWNKAHTTTQNGLLKRLQMIPDAGLNPMRVVAHSRLKQLGRIPRSQERHQEDAIAAVRRCGADYGNHPKAMLLFYSHQWKRPNWSEELGKDLPWASAERQQAMREGKRFGDPDDAARSKAKALVDSGEEISPTSPIFHIQQRASSSTTSVTVPLSKSLPNRGHSAGCALPSSEGPTRAAMSTSTS